jgi:hypothetical protein
MTLQDLPEWVTSQLLPHEQLEWWGRVSLSSRYHKSAALTWVIILLPFFPFGFFCYALLKGGGNPTTSVLSFFFAMSIIMGIALIPCTVFLLHKLLRLFDSQGELPLFSSSLLLSSSIYISFSLLLSSSFFPPV